MFVIVAVVVVVVVLIVAVVVVVVGVAAVVSIYFLGEDMHMLCQPQHAYRIFSLPSVLLSYLFVSFLRIPNSFLVMHCLTTMQ